MTNEVMRDRLAAAAQHLLDALDNYHLHGAQVGGNRRKQALRTAAQDVRDTLKDCETLTEQPCYCGPGISLQSVSGGAHETGLFGTVWLRIDDESVEYVRKSASPAVVPIRASTKLTSWPLGMGLEPEKVAQAEARIRESVALHQYGQAAEKEPGADDPYLTGVCTENGCSLCRTPVALRKRGQFYAGICNVSKEPGHD